jgi:uncharacterized protein
VTHRYRQVLFGPDVRAAQAAMGSRHVYADEDGAAAPDLLTEREAAFIAARDSFYMATTGAGGWPYLQHRGGPAGFVRVLAPGRLGFADFRGNRQYVSLGNLAADNRASLFFMDYKNRARLKLLGRVRSVTAAEDADLIARLADPGYRGAIERALLVEVEAFDWNCSQHITPRYTIEDIAPAVGRLEARIAELETDLAAARQTA